MNLQPLLLQALAARGGSAPNSALQALLTGTGSSEMAENLPSAQDLLSQLESTNPTAGMIAKYLLTARESEDQVSTEAEPEAGEPALPAEADEHLAQVVQRLEQRVNRWRTELERLRERNDILAAALGACYMCWGQDPGCRVCRGTGQAGSSMPDPPLFARWVAPAVQALESQKEVHRHTSNHRSSNEKNPPVKTKRGEQNA